MKQKNQDEYFSEKANDYILNQNAAKVSPSWSEYWKGTLWFNFFIDYFKTISNPSQTRDFQDKMILW